MHVFTDNTSELSRWIRNEVEFERELAKGSRGGAVKRVQEWLNLHNFGVAIDSDFGPVTARALGRFQEHVGLEATGKVDKGTFVKLVYPMRSVLEQRLSGEGRPQEGILAYAKAHLEQYPREVGGQNRGPWVRLYMKGNEGSQWPWCAGFVIFLLHQAVESLELPMPIEGSFSCDSLAAQAKEAGLFLQERDAKNFPVTGGSIFLVRRTSTDWTHTGLVTAAKDDAFFTIEGNTNDEGHREGYEVCSRSRGWKNKDFILIS